MSRWLKFETGVLPFIIATGMAPRRRSKPTAMAIAMTAATLLTVATACRADTPTLSAESTLREATLREAAPATAAPTPAAAAPALPGDQQGLTGDEIQTFYHLDQGGELFPLGWMLALEDEDGQPFVETLDRYGFLPDPNGPHGLPVGMTVSNEDSQLTVMPMVGMTCAACHVGEWQHDGQAVRVIGGPNLVDQKGFFTALAGAAKRSVEHPARLFEDLQQQARDETLSAALIERHPEAYKVLTQCTTFEEIAAAGEFGRLLKAKLGQLHAAEAGDVDVQPNHVDAPTHEPVDRGDTAAILVADHGGADLGEGCPLADKSTRAVAVHQMIDHFIETMRLLEGRILFLEKIVLLVHLPQTDFGPGRADDWDVARAELFDSQWAIPLTSPLSFPPTWNLDDIPWLHYDNNTNSIMQRNYGQAFGTGAPFELKTYGSTVDPRQLRLAEDLAREITPPEWPADVFGPIDTALAAEGESIFRARCATCHEGDQPGTAPGDKQYALDEIGTDPERITTFGTPLDGQPFAVVFPPVLDSFIDWSMDNEGIGEAEAKRLIGPEPEWRETNKYGTRALHGSWATAPYLHNGSVPTLHDLLRPAAERPTSFPIGSRAYDVVKLGLTIEGVDGWMFNVAEGGAPIAGNSNAGHEGAAFGTELSEEERRALLEFLKGY